MLHFSMSLQFSPPISLHPPLTSFFVLLSLLPPSVHSFPPLPSSPHFPLILFRPLFSFLCPSLQSSPIFCQKFLKTLPWPKKLGRGWEATAKTWTNVWEGDSWTEGYGGKKCSSRLMSSSWSLSLSIFVCPQRLRCELAAFGLILNSAVCPEGLNT